MAKNKHSLLDIFILYLVRDGLTSLYQLKREAGISIGAASPSLRRLEKKWITPITDRRRKPLVSVRGKREYQQDLFAYDFVNSDWLASFEAKLPIDIESVARLVALAEAKSRPDVARMALNNAIGERIKRARVASPETGRSSIASRYREIIHLCETARLKAEAATLKKVLARLK
jgi:hypothetical protein